MANQNQDREQDKLEKHSLPGTNQAGKGPGACDDDEEEHGPDGEGSPLPAGSKASAGPAPARPAGGPAPVKKD